MGSQGSNEDNTGLHRVNSSPERNLLPKWPPDATGVEKEDGCVPEAEALRASKKQGSVPHPTGRQIALALYHWTTCIFISVLVLSQFLGLFWNSVTSKGGAIYGSHPVAGGMSEITGTNDKPITDRVLACVLDGRYYKPVLLNDVLGTTGATAIPASTQAQGYRVVRHEGATLSDATYATYMGTCALMSNTLDMILDTCDNELGYHVTRDALRIVVDGEKAAGSSSDTVYLIEDSLPNLHVLARYRVSTVASPHKFTQRRCRTCVWLTFFISNVGPRMDANLALLMSIKLVLIGLNLLPLLLAAYIPPVKQPDTGLKGVERALAIRASNVGGLGSSLVYIYGVEHKGERRKVALNSYELVRLGYVVFGGQFLLTFDAWDVIMNTAVLHRVHHLWNYRVVLFPLRQRDGYAAVGDKPVVCRLDDARLDLIPFWDIAAQPVKC
ncbi:putative transmembrane protein [Phytophthora cinnamomi]|uniref:putative transmembrane protein n=2 Tax=Phytophthora cinnamomi TaxID=4785 RepID=UPI0035595009|nr:putative transmembrane protein [Phytophthora cinnamomi]